MPTGIYNREAFRRPTNPRGKTYAEYLREKIKSDRAYAEYESLSKRYRSGVKEVVRSLP